jgi:hypothetical protein
VQGAVIHRPKEGKEARIPRKPDKQKHVDDWRRERTIRPEDQCVLDIEHCARTGCHHRDQGTNWNA